MSKFGKCTNDRLKKVGRQIHEHHKLVKKGIKDGNFRGANEKAHDQGKIGDKSYSRNKKINKSANDAKHVW